jgi:hypothetical protein
MSAKSEIVAQIGDRTYISCYNQCDRCGLKHNQMEHKDEEGRYICPRCELENLGQILKRKMYIIDGDTDQIVGVFDKSKFDYSVMKTFEERNKLIKELTGGKEVWWAMNNVTGKLDADVYIISDKLTRK